MDADANRKVVLDYLAAQAAGDGARMTEAKAANGRDYSNEYVWVYICANGKIVEIEEHTDSLRFHEIVQT